MDWDRTAVLTQHSSGMHKACRDIDAGTLIEVCARLWSNALIDLRRVTISLADEAGPPTTFSGLALSMLLFEVPFQVELAQDERAIA